MPEKLDFGQALISGYDSQSITNAAKETNADVVIQDPETYKKMGLNDDQIGIVNQQYDAYKRGEYVANQNVRYGTHSLFAELTHPQAMAITRSPLLRPGGLQRSAPAGYDIYGRQFATEQEVADQTGQFVNSDGQWEDLGGEFWSWIGKAGMGILDLGNTASNIAGGWAVNLGLDAAGLKTTNELMDDLHGYAESKVLNYDPYGNPYWQVFNPYENPKSAGDKTKVWWDGFFSNEQAQEINKGLIMNPKGYMRSLYGAQPFESRTGLGNFGRGIIDTIDTAIPNITGGITGFAGNIETLITGAPEEEWSYLKSVSRSAFLRADQTKHPK